MKEFDRMSVQTGRVVSADEALSIAARGNRDLVHWAEIRDMAETIAAQAEQIAAELARVAEARVEGYRLGYADADNGNDPIEWASR